MLEVRRLSKIFFEPERSNASPDSSRSNDISLAIRKKRVCFLCSGQVAGGKTTLIRIIAGLLAADRGDVLVNQQCVTAPGRDRCMVFSTIWLAALAHRMSNVEFGLEIEGMARDERRAVADKYLDLVGLKGFESYYPHQISGGMQQRVGIAGRCRKSRRFC